MEHKNLYFSLPNDVKNIDDNYKDYFFYLDKLFDAKEEKENTRCD